MTKKTPQKIKDEFSSDTIAYAEFVRNRADATDLYKTILRDLIFDPENPHRGKIIPAENVDDFAKVEIGTNFLGKYIIQLVNDMISFVGEEHGREESEDAIREKIGLELLKRFDKNSLFFQQENAGDTK